MDRTETQVAVDNNGFSVLLRNGNGDIGGYGRFTRAGIEARNDYAFIGDKLNRVRSDLKSSLMYS
jgi:hypothetical protein